MTDTSEADVTPQTNGFGDGEEDDRTKMRPADIDADMREMERRKRVEMIMSSRLFREELERIIEAQMKDGNGPAGLLQQISDMMGIQGGRLQSANFFKTSNCVVPINDIRGVESMGYAKGEKILRCKLAAVYRLMDLYGWTQNIYNHITARLNQDQEHFLVNPFGMLYHEVTASSLVKVDMQGHVVESGTTNFGVNVAGFQLHGAVHAARPDIKCIIHLHTPPVLAVSSLKCGLLPLCQESVVIGEASQHTYMGSISEPEEKEKLARDLGPLNKVVFLTNHGALCCGETIEEAFYNVYNTVLACEIQLKLIPVGIDNLQLIPDETRKQIYDSARHMPEGTAPPPSQIDKKEKRFRIGGLEFEALMRMLDNAGFRTGYIYRQPLVKGDPPRPRNDVEVPPAVSSLGYLLEEEEMYKHGNWKKYVDGRKSNDRTRWLNSPNVYQKVEILETGTPDPKKITKWVDANADEWVTDGSPQHSSTPVKIEHALQFVPKNTNPKEFKKLQQQIKENRRADKITSGPQSHILEGVSWEEAKKLQDANISQTGDQVILVGAASKGIIQRGFQHNATVYKAPYAKNPFDAVSDQEIEDYKKVVNRKQRGESSYDEDQSESEALSSSAALPPTGIKSPASETDDSRDGPRVLRIETKQVPRPSQAEVVLSDDAVISDTDLLPTNMQRSKSSRYPDKEPVSQLNRSNSLGRNQRNNKDACGNGPGTGRGNLHEDNQVNPNPCPPSPQAVKVYMNYTNVPLPCEVITLGTRETESLYDEEHCFNSIKKDFCNFLNNELKNEDYSSNSASDKMSSTMMKLLEDLKTKLCKMRLARKKFFENRNSRETVNTDQKDTSKNSNESHLGIENYEVIHLEKSVVESAQMSQIVVIDDSEEDKGCLLDHSSTSCPNVNDHSPVLIPNESSYLNEEEECLVGFENLSFGSENESITKYDDGIAFNSRAYNLNSKNSTELFHLLVTSDNEYEENNNYSELFFSGKECENCISSMKSCESSNFCCKDQYSNFGKRDNLIGGSEESQENVDKTKDHQESSFNEDFVFLNDIDAADSNSQSDNEDLFCSMYEEECCCIERYNDNWKVNENRCHFVSGSDTSSLCKCMINSDEESIYSEPMKQELDFEFVKKKARKTWKLRKRQSSCSEELMGNHHCLTPEEEEEMLISPDVHTLLLEKKTSSSIPFDVFACEKNVGSQTSLDKDTSLEYNEHEELVGINVTEPSTKNDELNSQSLPMAPYVVLKDEIQNKKLDTNEQNQVEMATIHQDFISPKTSNTVEHNVKEVETLNSKNKEDKFSPIYTQEFDGPAIVQKGILDAGYCVKELKPSNVYLIDQRLDSESAKEFGGTTTVHQDIVGLNEECSIVMEVKEIEEKTSVKPVEESVIPMEIRESEETITVKQSIVTPIEENGIPMKIKEFEETISVQQGVVSPIEENVFPMEIKEMEETITVQQSIVSPTDKNVIPIEIKEMEETITVQQSIVSPTDENVIPMEMEEIEEIIKVQQNIVTRIEEIGIPIEIKEFEETISIQQGIVSPIEENFISLGVKEFEKSNTVQQDIVKPLKEIFPMNIETSYECSGIEEIVPFNTRKAKVNSGINHTDSNNNHEGETSSNSRMFSKESFDVGKYILMLILERFETLPETIKVISDSDDLQLRSCRIVQNILKSSLIHEKCENTDDISVDEQDFKTTVSKRSVIRSTDSGCNNENSQDEYTSELSLSNENSMVDYSELNETGHSHTELSFYSVFDEPVITTETVETHETADSCFDFETVIHTVVEVCFDTEPELLDNEVKDSKVNNNSENIVDVSPKVINENSSSKNLPSSFKTDVFCKRNDFCVIEEEIKRSEDLEIHHMFAATDDKENELFCPMNLSKENSSSDGTTNGKKVFIDETNFEPIPHTDSPDSFKTVWIKAIPHQKHSSNMDSSDFESEEGTNTSGKLSCDSDSINDIIQLPSTFEDNTSSVLATLNNHIDPEFEGGTHGSAISVIDTERELYFKLAETILTSSSSSPEPDSLECNIVPKAKSSQSLSSPRESNEANIPNEYNSQSIYLENNSKNCSESPERFNIDAKVHSFIVIDNKKPNKSQSVKSVRKMKPKAILLDSKLATSADDSKDSSLIACDDLLDKRSIDNFSDFYSFEPSSPDSTKSEFQIQEMPGILSSVSFRDSPRRLTQFKNAPQSSPLESFYPCYDQKHSDLCEDQNVSYYNSEESFEESILLLSAIEEPLSAKSNDTGNVFEVFQREKQNDSELFHALPKYFKDKRHSYHEIENINDYYLADTVIGTLLCSSSLVADRGVTCSEGDNIILSSSICVETEHSLCEDAQNEVKQDLSSEDLELISVFFDESSKSDSTPSELGNTQKDFSTFNDFSYLPASSVDDEIFEMKSSSTNSVLSYTDSLLSGEEGESVTYENSVPNRSVANNCCQYSPLSFKKPTSLSPIPESDLESD